MHTWITNVSLMSTLTAMGRPAQQERQLHFAKMMDTFGQRMLGGMYVPSEHSHALLRLGTTGEY